MTRLEKSLTVLLVVLLILLGAVMVRNAVAAPTATTSEMQHQIDVMIDCYNNVYNIPGGLGMSNGDILIACSNLAASS